MAGLATTFGSGAMTNSINEVNDAACILSIGSNTCTSHPVIGMYVKQANRKGAKLIVINPREIDLVRYADLWLQQRPGTDVALLMGMMKIIVDEGLADSSFIEQRCENFAALKESLNNFPLDLAEHVSGVPGKKIVEVIGLVKGNTIRARHLGRDILAMIRALIGGEVSEYTKMIAESREQALDRMVAEAQKLGANAIVTLRFTTSSMMQGAAELLAYGTAVRVENDN